MTWVYEDKPFTELPKGIFGFVYMLHYTDNTFYIGKKQCITEKHLPALKNGAVRTEAAYRVGRNINGKRVQFDVVLKETYWKRYTGSSKLTAGKTIAHKEIVALARSKRELTYLETKYLFCYEVLEKEEFVNECIMNRFWKGRLF